jgi:hypothetical protein
VTFEGLRLTAHYHALEPVRFPDGKAGNTLRGAFGLLASAALFSPRQRSGPSGLADPPRPFAFRAHHLDGAAVEGGEHFGFDLHLFYPSPETLAECRGALASLRHLGSSRSQVTLDRIDVSEPLVFPLEPMAVRFAAARVRFVTATEIKGEGGLVVRPDFATLFARIRDRLSTLRALYGPGPLPVDFRALGERARDVHLVRDDLRQETANRRSSRTGQTHPLGGFRGEALYEGDLAPFVPWLRAAEFAGVGRQTVWGKGAIQVEPIAT